MGCVAFLKVSEGEGGLVAEVEKVSKPDVPVEKIEDFGEVLAGAAKHNYTLRETLESEVDVKALPLSKSFPKPDYEKLVAGGMSKADAAFIAQLRGEIRVKPRKGPKLTRWVESVTSAREQASRVMSGELSLSKPEVVAGFRKETSYIQFLPDIMLLAEALPVDRIERLGNFKIEKNHYSMIMDVVDGERVGRKNVDKFDVVDTSQKGYGRMNSGKPVHFDTAEAAVAYVKEQMDSPNVVAKRTTKLDMWSERGKEGGFVGKKVAASKYIELGSGFKNATEAAKFIDANYDDLVGQLAQKRKKPQFRREGNLPRVGPDRRQGKDVTPEQFGETFGFRGVQFGNWVENDKYHFL